MKKQEEEVTDDLIKMAKETLELYTEEYEEVLKIIEKGIDMKSSARRLMIMVEGFLFVNKMFNINKVIDKAPYPDNILLKQQFSKFVELIDKHKHMAIIRQNNCQ